MHMPLSASLSTPLATLLATPWLQNYDPTHLWWLSTILAALPLLVLLLSLLGPKLHAHYAALASLAVALLITIGIFHMPAHLALTATVFGAAYGLFPIFWITLPVLFLYRLTVQTGRFHLLQESLIGVTQDSRLQLILIAFALGAFFEGAAGFGTPVAVCGTILIGLGFPPLQAAGLSLIANTAPVAFGSVGIPTIALQGVTGLDLHLLTSVLATLLTPFCVIIPFWLVWAFSGFKRMIEIWPPILLTGVTFAVAQLTMARLHGPWLVDMVASVLTMILLIAFLRIWHPKQILDVHQQTVPHRSSFTSLSPKNIRKAILPWFVLAACVTLWGTRAFSTRVSALTTILIPVPFLSHMVIRVPPAVATAAPEAAVFTFNWATAAGTGVFLAALIAGFLMGLKPREMAHAFWKTIVVTRFSAITIAALIGLSYLTRFCGLDATLGLAFARTGVLYPFFGAIIGWLGTASTGSDTSSNVLFGSLQKLTAQQLGISPYIMAAANSGGGVMGKMVDAQSIVVSTTATNSYGEEGNILRFVLLHSLAMVTLMGLLVSLVVHSPFLLHLLLDQ